MKQGDTIAAISTATGKGGVGIVRISGPRAEQVASALFEHAGGGNGFRARYAHYGRIFDPATSATLDQSVATLFAAPASYTGEDVVEFSCHGSQPVLERVVELACQHGARPAAPGEFTYRAVINGKLDLAQAEAVNDLINADTLLQAEQAIAQVEGEVGEVVNTLSQTLISLAARLEAEVDFAEEGENFSTRQQIANLFEGAIGRVRQIAHIFASARLFAKGATVVLVGRTNAGKSTLFNSFLSEERSIVDKNPGTTRDYITEKVELEGIPVTFVDTAGIRETDDAVEKTGISRTQKMINKADLVVHVYDAAEKNVGVSVIEGALVVANKADLCEGLDAGDVQISAQTGEGIDALKELIISRLGLKEFQDNKLVITHKRQQDLFLKVADNLNVANGYFHEEAYDELVLEELNQALRNLKSITGKGTADDVLGEIFSSFCVGK